MVEPRPSCVCVITVPQDAGARIRTMDLDYSSQSDEQRACPVRIDVPGEFRCARRDQHEDIYLKPAPNQRDLADYVVHTRISTDLSVHDLRLWLEIEGKIGEIFLFRFYRSKSTSATLGPIHT